jgi:septum formation protein
VSGVVPSPEATAPSLVLASTSRYRVELLQRLDLAFQAVSHRCDEDAFKQRHRSPVELAAALSRAKAESVHAGSFVLGSDQVCVLGTTVFSKPGAPARAEAQLAQLSGNTHQLITAVALRHPSGVFTERTSVHQMTMRPLSAAAIARYVAADAPLDCAGSYKIEGRGIALFSSIAGDDFTGIVGLPLMAVTDLLAQAGFQVL